MASQAAKRFGSKGINDAADAIFSGIENSFINFGTGLVTDLQGSLRKKGVTFGGNDSQLSNLIRFDIKQTKDGIKFQLLMPEYGFAVDGGRKPSEKGSKPGQLKNNIEEWVKRKGLVGKFKSKKPVIDVAKQKEYRKAYAEKLAKGYKPKPRKRVPGTPFEKAAKQLAFLISRKIHRKGYKGNNFYSEVIDKLDINKLNKELSKVMKEQVLVQIKKR